MMRRKKRDQSLDDEQRESQSSDAACHGEHHALCQKLPDHSPAARPHREADCDFLLPRRGAGRQQTCHIGAGDQQHQADHGHQDEQRLFVRAPQVGVALSAGQRLEPHSQELLRIVWSGVAEVRQHDLRLQDLVEQRLQSCLGLLDGHSRFETAIGVHPALALVV
jgi:hypothetical protein